MILLKKGPKPQILVDNETAWTATYVEKRSRGEEPTKAESSRYGHVQIKDAIKAETHGKCAYCESKLQHIAYGDVEHVLPKHANPPLRFTWENLTLACDICNTKKGEKDGIMDPYVPDPEASFMFFGSSMYPLDDPAKLTEHELELNREDLVGRRIERLEYLLGLIRIISMTDNVAVRAILIADFQNELTDQREYAAMSRAFAREATSKGLLA